MAREAALWQRCRTGIKALAWQGHKIDVQRVENSAVSGHPDVEGCIDGGQLWVELKSCERPVRESTPIRPKCRPSQSIWHNKRTSAGSRIHWVLIQVGEDRGGILYLIPGSHYDEVAHGATEARLAELSVVPATATTADVLVRAVAGW